MSKTTTLPALSATALKNILWDTLAALKSGAISIDEVTACAAISREITRTVNTQLKVAAQTGRDLAQEVLTFSES